MNIFLPLVAGWTGAIQGAAQGAGVDREIPWISVVILGLSAAAFIVVQVAFLYWERRWFVMRRVPFGIAYELKRIAERERRSPGQQALVWIEQGLEAAERRGLVIRRLPSSVAYGLERLAERECRSLDQQAVALIEEALQAREAARYGRAGAYGGRGGELRRAV